MKPEMNELLRDGRYPALCHQAPDQTIVLRPAPGVAAHFQGRLAVEHHRGVHHGELIAKSHGQKGLRFGKAGRLACGVQVADKFDIRVGKHRVPGTIERLPLRLQTTWIADVIRVMHRNPR